MEKARAYVLGGTVCGLAVAIFSVVDLIRHPVGIQWLILVALTIGSSWATLRIPSMPISFSISDTFSIAAALMFGPSAGAITAALDGLVLSSRMANDDRTVGRVLFNMATLTVPMWVAATVFFAMGGSQPLGTPLSPIRLLALILFGALYFGLNSGIVAVAVSFERKVPVLSIWRQHLSGVWVTYFGGIFGARLLIVLAQFSTLDALILVIPLPVILYVTFRHAVGRAEDQIDHLGKVNRVYVAAIEAFAHAVDAKDQVTHDHTRRVQDQTMHLARALAVDDEGEIQAIKAAALLHDVGKLAVPEHILNKPGRLTPAEYEIMKRHAPVGADILSVIGFPYAVAPIVRHHHENWDGSGYPDGISGDAIPTGSRILAVVDCFDALTSDRPYRPRMEDSEALKILSDRSGTMYDPRVVDAFFRLHGHNREAASAAAAPAAVPLPALASTADARQTDVEAQTVHELRRALGTVRSVTQLGDVVWAHVGPQVPASTFVLYAYDAANDAIAAAYKAGAERGLVNDAPVPLGERLSGWVAATSQTVMNSDARLDLDEPVREHSRLRSALAVAVVLNGRVAAVLTLYAENANAFTEADQRLVEAAGRLLSEHVPLAAYLSVPVLSVS
ncbi:MAG TPA: HD domain-containing phosphohydrolase [Vicinamibacterales bacterium]